MKNYFILGAILSLFLTGCSTWYQDPIIGEWRLVEHIRTDGDQRSVWGSEDQLIFWSDMILETKKWGVDSYHVQYELVTDKIPHEIYLIYIPSEPEKSKKAFGIYEVEGDELTIGYVIAPPQVFDPRNTYNDLEFITTMPSDFNGDRGVYKRVK